MSERIARRTTPRASGPGLATAWIAAGILAATAGLNPSPLLACTCVEPGPPARELEAAAAVFAGRVVDLSDVAGPTGDDDRIVGYRVTFVLEKVWKGIEEGQIVSLTTGWGDWDCGHPFRKGRRYLVYAYGDPDDLSTGICSRTARWRNAEEDRDALGEPLRVIEGAAEGSS